MAIDIANDVPELAHLCGGASVAAGDERYEAARMAWASNAPQRPELVVYPADEREVAAVIRAARSHDLRVVPQGTGHNAHPLGKIEDTILVRTRALNGVRVDPERRIARVGSGILIEEVVDAAAEHGLSVLHGSTPDVSIAGYSLGGGLGWQARKRGLQCNALTAVELVNADGEALRTSIDENPELFWALRGGGGNFGVVTALEFRLFPLESAYAGALVWPAERTHEVLTEWSRWAVDAPDEVTTSLRVLNLPPLPGVPEFLAGRRVVMIDGAVLGDDELGRELIAPLRALDPELDMFDRLPAKALLRIHGDPEEPTPIVSKSENVAELPAAAIDAWVQATTGPEAGDLPLLAELRQLGGAVGRIPDNAGALTHLPGQFMSFNAGFAPDEQLAAASHELVCAIQASIEPWLNGRHYLNFVEEPADTATMFERAAHERLKKVRDEVDPERVFCANHVIG